VIERLNAYRVTCDACQSRSEVYHAEQHGALPLPSGWVRVPGTGDRSYAVASTERVLCPYCAIKRRDNGQIHAPSHS